MLRRGSRRPRDRAPAGAILAAAALACAPEAGSLEVRFPSAPLRDATREVRLFAFAAGAEGEPPRCKVLDPRGLGPGDAEQRTGLGAAARASASLAPELARFSDLAPGTYTLVVEAWGPPCEQAVGVGSGDEPRCARLADRGEPILRGYHCSTLELRRDERLELAVDLEPLALIGALMEVPTALPVNAVAFDDANPLLAAAGLRAAERMVVQLFDHTRESVNGVAVRWSVSEGEGAIAAAQPGRTDDDRLTLERGISDAYLVAGRSAPQAGAGRIVVTAHAPGYEGSPIRFVAQTVPAVRTIQQRFQLPRELVPLDSASRANQPLALADLDRDGRLDAVTSVGSGTHRLVVLYGDGELGYTLRVTAEQPREVRALTPMRVGGGEVGLAVSVAERVGQSAQVGGQRVFRAREPALELWRGLGERGPSTELSVTPTVFASIDGRPIEKLAVAIDAAELGRDDVDELVLSRCSYSLDSIGGSSPLVDCAASLESRTDSELAVLRMSRDGDRLALDELVLVPAEARDGGMREARFLDVNADGSLDLVFATASQVNFVCGNRNQPEAAFGFASAPRERFTAFFAGTFTVAAGRFSEDGISVITSGASRASSREAGFVVSEARGCEWGPSRPVVTARRARDFELMARVANVNGDRWDDVILLERATQNLRLHLGAGGGRLASGPALQLGSSALGPLAVAIERVDEVDRVVAATLDRTTNELVLFRFFAE
jgi:hypothetical protein